MKQHVCLVVLIGLPASGKTTFASSFSADVNDSNFNGSQYNVIHVCYDDLLQLEDVSTSWKDIRKNLIGRVDKLISLTMQKHVVEVSNCCQDTVTDTKNVNGNPLKTLILVDDNMYYRSMSLEIARQNNLKREMRLRVSDHVIKRMSAKLEPPDSKHYSWEKFSLTLSCCNYNKEVQRSVLELIDQSLTEVVMPKKCVPSKDSEESKAVCLVNVLHQVDILSRKLLRQMMAEKCEEGVSKQELQTFSIHINRKRQSLLRKIKMGEIQYPEQINLRIVSCDSVPETILQNWVSEAFAQI